MRMLHDVFRRRLRVLLTIFGITIGVLALVFMGSMAEKINLLVAGASRHYSDKVQVVAEGSSFISFTSSSGPMSLSLLSRLKSVAGVAEVSAGVVALLSPGSSFALGMPAMFLGSDMRGEELETFEITYSSGRALTPSDIGSVTVGSDLVKRLSAKVGGYVAVRGEQFKVVGILDKTLTAPDNQVWMTLPDAQRLLVRDMPEVVSGAMDGREVVNSFMVYPAPGADPDRLAAVINESVAGVNATGPSTFRDEVGSATRILSAIVFGIAVIALIVGGLSVINTMTISVNERTREIGIRKAIGASDGQIVRQFLGEAAVIGLTGGVMGLLLAWVTTTIANAALETSGLRLFLVTPRLAAGAVVFAVFLGVLSGLYPALHAARLDPVAALRDE